jgi:hypothetical protein
MAAKQTPAARVRQDEIVAEARRYQAQREQSYRAQALKLYPWICARCGREFSGKTLRELTVHHKDHNHDHNPPDGSNWELLCLYCHENEHARQQEDITDGFGLRRAGALTDAKTGTESRQWHRKWRAWAWEPVQICAFSPWCCPHSFAVHSRHHPYCADQGSIGAGSSMVRLVGWECAPHE